MQNFFCSGAFALSRISYTAELSSLSKMSFTVGLFFKAEFFNILYSRAFSGQKFLYSGAFSKAGILTQQSFLWAELLIQPSFLSKQNLLYSGAFSLSSFSRNFLYSGAFSFSRLSYTAEFFSRSRIPYTACGSKLMCVHCMLATSEACHEACATSKNEARMHRVLTKGHYCPKCESFESCLQKESWLQFHCRILHLMVLSFCSSFARKRCTDSNVNQGRRNIISTIASGQWLKSSPGAFRWPGVQPGHVHPIKINDLPMLDVADRQSALTCHCLHACNTTLVRVWTNQGEEVCVASPNSI